MRGLNRAMERLRPLVDSSAWDYCVVWKLGDDPSRFIEWVGCCCGGGGGGGGGYNVERDRREDNQFGRGPLCKDVYFKHPVRTKACEALSRYPSSMPLYSGIHGEVVISAEPRWLCHATVTTHDSNTLSEVAGTQVLIPVIGGLVELFAAKHMKKDEKMIESIRAHCHVPIKQEAVTEHGYSNSSFDDHRPDSLLEENSPPSCHLLSLIPQTQFLLPLTQPRNSISFEGSSSGSNPSIEAPSFVSNASQLPQHGHLQLSVGKSIHDENILKQRAGSADCNKKVPKVIRRSERDDYKSKNLVTERNRRTRIKTGLFALRALVPKISKMDKAAILGDAIDYVGELLKEVKNLQDEIKNAEEEERRASNIELKTSKTGDLSGKTTCLLLRSTRILLVQLEVDQISKRQFLLKFLCEQRQGGFGRLMETIHSLGLQILDANITTFNGNVLNILKVEADKDIHPKTLKKSLIELTGNLIQTFGSQI
ncbi:hypothetical protein D5086_017087 [Populus alba]|uniref:Uncharacterized protein n=2 Tax=Populus alba TaxID=43335 RepID=A0ACC4BVV9_POPAL|nr:transcription factor bHLH90-like [Populus alba]TKS05626.1 hypothetical protein D5086_0000131010 [Populus alba]